MVLTVEQCDAYLVTLYAGLGTGVASITYQGRSVTYSTSSHIQAAINFFEKRRAALLAITAASTGWPAHRRLVRFSSGLASSDSPY
jgi:hypothetical protein